MRARAVEIAWLIVLIVLVAAGGRLVLYVLAVHRLAGSLVLALAVVAAIVMIRRAYVPQAPTVRADVTKAVGYCCSAILALVAVAAQQHWAIGSAIIALEVSLAFDVLTVAAAGRHDGDGASTGPS